ncbi:acyltransferase family protein [Photobacterium aquimaris]|uniref:O-acetyltransferase OatA n=1 Tax=Photobacterium aquimaris TaxID=512643 RepID=A0A1Y6KZ88_9GAMM|nr:acyltransferase family protein [Photobacterium aquimaris]SMY17490.1 O-acetyltransferase OatA [Photobacterium aquimaris]
MKFRNDINGLRAVAVIAVVLFHFNPVWIRIPGGFAGVDVFFVISGFLMTSIIFRGLANNRFSTLKFYIARANRIIPALMAMCSVLLILGWFYLTPVDYRILGKHIAGSSGFISNIFYFKESGYFDAGSHEKWLLHTWSLSVEWQFYIIYPIVLVILNKIFKLTTIKKILLVITGCGFLFNLYVSHQNPTYAYFLLPVRGWEMMLGGLVYLYPVQLNEKNKKYCQWLGVLLIIAAYSTMSEKDMWPGYLALMPVEGAFLIILANRQQGFFNNVILQRIGLWSYSIYLWHWPLVVIGYYLSIPYFEFIGIPLSVLLGALSYRYIENRKISAQSASIPRQLITSPPVWLIIIVGGLAAVVFKNNGFAVDRFPASVNNIVKDIKPTPNRINCHVYDYQDPAKACEYYGKNIDWAVLGDSHAISISYALANRLKATDQGLKHFSFAGCIPSYGQKNNFSHCSRWYNEAANYILQDKQIQNVVLINRYSAGLYGENEGVYPRLSHQKTAQYADILTSFDKLVLQLAKTKKNVYVIEPVPEMGRSISKLFYEHYWVGKPVKNTVSMSKSYYNQRNHDILRHFKQAKYPENVHLINTQQAFCDNRYCYAVRDSQPLYHDAHHASQQGAEKVVSQIVI